MKLTLEKDDGTTEVFQEITDLYVIVRQAEPVYYAAAGPPQSLITIKSFSWGSNIRELVKELQQSLLELQDLLRSIRNGGSS